MCTPVRLARRFSHVRTNRRRGESNRALNLRADNRRTESDALDPMFEKPQKAQVVRIKIEAISLDSTSIAPSLDGPLLARTETFAIGRVRARACVTRRPSSVGEFAQT